VPLRAGLQGYRATAHMRREIINVTKKTPRTALLRREQPRNPCRSALFLDLCDLDALTVNDWILPALFMRGQVSALVGDKSTNKTSIAICLATMKAYGDPWHDGTAISPGAALYVVGEGLSGMRNRRRASLRALGKAEPEHLADFFKVVDARAASLNLLDPESVAALVSAVREQIEREGLRLDIVFLDTLSALIGDESPRTIVNFVRHMRLIAEELNCHVCVLHHTQRGTNQYRGPGQFGGNLDAVFVTVKERRDRTLLYVEKQREGENGFSFVFDRSIVTLGIDKHSKPITSVAMALVGKVADDDSALNHDSYRRKQIAEAMQPGQRLSVSAVVRLLKWSKDGYGGVQHGWVDDAIPEDEWIAVQVADGTIRELRRSRQGAVTYVECRNAGTVDVPVTNAAPTAPLPEPAQEPAIQPHEPASPPAPRPVSEDARYRLADRGQTYAATPASSSSDPASWAEQDGVVADDIIARCGMPDAPPDPQPPRSASAPVFAQAPDPGRAASASSAAEASSENGAAAGRDAINQDISKMIYGRMGIAKVVGSPSGLVVEAFNEEKTIFLRANLKSHPEVEDQFAVEVLAKHEKRYLIRELAVEAAGEQAKIATINWDVVVGPEAKSDLVRVCKIAKADKEKAISFEVINGRLGVGPAEWSFNRQNLEWALRKNVTAIKFAERGVLSVTATGVAGDYEFFLRGKLR
jgi:KaiC/GvpD/RAD55 family RecA-like ATPase